MSDGCTEGVQGLGEWRSREEKEEREGREEGWGLTKAGKQRQRLPLACTSCRRKKIRCSGTRPVCTYCAKHDIQCVYHASPRTSSIREVSICPGTGSTGSLSVGSVAGRRVFLRHPALPSPSATERMLGVFFVRFNNQACPLVHQESLLALLSDETRPDPSSSLLLAMLAVAAPWCGHDAEVYAAPARETVLPFVFDAPNVEHVVALLLLAAHEFRQRDQIRQWMYLGTALRMLVGLRLHRELLDGPGLSSEALGTEMQQRVFWSAFVMDTLACTRTHRPPMLREEECPLPFPTDQGSHLAWLVKLCTVWSQVATACHEPDQHDLQCLDAILVGLQDWKTHLPVHLALDTPATVLMHLLYHFSLLALHRLAFVIASSSTDASSANTADVPPSDKPAPCARWGGPEDTLNSCRAAATSICEIHEACDHQEAATLTAPFAGYALLASCTFNATVAQCPSLPAAKQSIAREQVSRGTVLLEPFRTWGPVDDVVSIFTEWYEDNRAVPMRAPLREDRHITDLVTGGELFQRLAMGVSGAADELDPREGPKRTRTEEEEEEPSHVRKLHIHALLD